MKRAKRPSKPKKPPFPKSGVAIVLSMIVKNEEKIIDRFLETTFPFVDAFVITDTGSTDKTLEKISGAANKHKKIGATVNDGWRDFGWNRTRAMSFTVDYVKGVLGWDPSKTYALLLDADMVLVDEGFSRSELTGPAYEIAQRAPGLNWKNPRLCRLDHTWVAHGVTHEFWGSTPNTNLEFLESLWIDDRGDGSSHTHKQLRDIALLRQGLVEEPTNVRYMFYLAQTLFDLGRYAEALAMYERRVELGGWDEEVWFSKYKIGICRLNLGDEDSGIADLIRAYDFRPGRAEPLSALAQHLRKTRGRGSASGLIFAEAALALPDSKDKLFVSTHANEQEPLEEIGVLAYYAGKRDLGRNSIERLLSLRGVDGVRSNQALTNLLFYTNGALPFVRRGKFTVPKELRTFNGIIYETSSASIVEHDGELFSKIGSQIIVNVRLVNYYHERGRVFSGRDTDQKIRTENYIGQFRNEDVEGGKLLRAMVPATWTDESRVLGLEDLRLVSHLGKLYFTAVAYQIPGRVGYPQMVFGREKGDHFEVCPFEYEGTRPIEKNWLPFSDGKNLLIVYGYEPFKLLKVDVETGYVETFLEQRLPFSGERWRGSAPPTRLGNGRRVVMLVHEVARRADDNVYLHRFVELDPETFVPQRYSRIFSFEHHGVEYALGMIATGGDNVIVTYGYEERESHWVEINLRDVEWLTMGDLSK